MVYYHMLHGGWYGMKYMKYMKIHLCVFSHMV